MRADVNGLSWRKSSYSNGEGGDCVEVSDDLPGPIRVRDSKLADTGPVLAFPAASWALFVAAVRFPVPLPFHRAGAGARSVPPGGAERGPGRGGSVPVGIPAGAGAEARAAY
ncbi:DUF397 domain-containing protein [Streptomyces sp. PCS3-D2]|uniref:DUF397 domain-containing protein n=1 Tax=Streptomyces sp. PCS3-D2 TaxID=1460244 RepID=UPI00044DD498|nr:DUF397 domain-containing protein [Streptomyces sp. PCS3-D2]WKV74556.1 DUF397 domain-containing protein [Streptomyces sp. PCS3-D2]